MLFLTTTVTGAGAAALQFERAQRAFLLPGRTTDGHHQIELDCFACHSPTSGVKVDACVACHGAELELADDSHPAAKFRDPRNADRLQQLDALDCVTCHVEHRAEVTFTMGVTQPPDFCIHCHADIGRDRPTHTGLGFETCQAAGCHNYHDNRALHVDYLEAQLEETGAMADRRVPALRRLEPKNPAVASHDAPAHVHAGEALPQWAASAHARGGVNCRDCHDRDSEGALAGRWQDVPPRGACSACHAAQVGGFEAGKHGMRLARGMQPMRPADARLPMRSEAYDRELDCQSCHGAHAYDRGAAAVDACLGCHDDAHSRAYRASPHYASFRAEQEGRAPEGSGVSCATCHMPRVEHPETGEPMVQHNQNDNLRPSEKMVRPVCGRCHAVAFVLDALADRALVARNFAGRPALHVESMDMLRAKLGKLTSTAPRNPRSKPEETP